MPRPAFSDRCRKRWLADRLRLYRQGLQPARIQPEVRRIWERSNSSARSHCCPSRAQKWGVGSPAKVPLDQLIIERGKYRPTERMTLAATYPIVQGYQKKLSPGYYIHFEDPMQFHQLSATLSVSPFGKMRMRDRLHAEIEYKTLSWELNISTTAPTSTTAGGGRAEPPRRHLLRGLQQDHFVRPAAPIDLFGSATAYFGLERLPGAQNIAIPKNILRWRLGPNTPTAQVAGGVDHEKGVAWRALANLDYAQSELFPKLSARLDYGLPLPIANMSAWVYAQAGAAWGDRLHPLAAFYFGSFRNNYIDNRPEKRYREVESFPGFEIDEIAARRFGKLTGEINLPPIRFAEVGHARILPELRRPACSRHHGDTIPRRGLPPLLSTGGAVRSQFHRCAAPADGPVDRGGGRLGGWRLPQKRTARFAEDHVVSPNADCRDYRLVDRAGAGAGCSQRLSSGSTCSS